MAPGHYSREKCSHILTCYSIMGCSLYATARIRVHVCACVGVCVRARVRVCACTRAVRVHRAHVCSSIMHVCVCATINTCHALLTDWLSDLEDGLGELQDALQLRVWGRVL